MASSSYPEIEALRRLRLQHRIRLYKRSEAGLLDGESSLAVRIFVGSHPFDLFIEDEYRDWDEANPDLCLFLVLRDLELYAETEDYLAWCRERACEPANEKVRNYHMELRQMYQQLERLLDKIDSQISPWDYEMNAGAAYSLRNPTES